MVRRLLAGLLLVVVGFTLVFGAALLILQRRLIYFPGRYQVREVSALLPRGGKTLAYQAGTLSMRAYWVPGPEAGPSDPIVVVFSGNATLAAAGWSDWIEEVWRESPSASFYLVEYPGYGENPGKPSRANIIAATGPAWRRLADELEATPEELASRTVALGHSLGAAAAMEFAVREHPRRVVLIAPFSSVKSIARETVGPIFCHLLLDDFDNGARLDEYLSAQPAGRVLITHSADDVVLPIGPARELATGAGDRVKFVEFPTGGHEGVIDLSLPEVVGILRELPAPAPADPPGSPGEGPAIEANS